MEPGSAPSWVGRQLKNYQVLGALGAGGMGQVFRARDTKLDREVALKILPEAFSEDPERLMRFQREARLLAALNHPNIAAIHGIEEAEGRHVLVLELAEGETLADRVRRRALPIREALAVFRQMAEGLEAAHEKGIIHRDLKPANVVLTTEGQVKILDFGLAKASWEEIPEDDPSASPTVSVGGTQAGTLLGTAAYMSPEQARGDQLDERADIWAFGCVLYEALTGQRAFKGRTVPDTLAGVLERDVDWDALPEGTPDSVRRVLRRCLEKEKARRLRHIADARMEIEDALDEPSGFGWARPGTVPVQARAPRRPLWQVALAGLVLAGAASLATWAVFRTEPPPRPGVTRFTIDVAKEVGEGARLITGGGNPLAIAPDGSRLAYMAGDAEGGRRLYLRELDQFESRPLPVTERGYNPFFSPDGRSLGFGGPDLRTVLRVSIDGGPPLELGQPDRFSGAMWGRDGRIIANTRGGIWELSSSGGEAKPLPALRGKSVHQLLPRGELLISDAGFPDDDTIEIATPETSERRGLMRARTYWAHLLPSGHLIWSSGEALLAVKVPPQGAGPVGAPVPVLEGLHVLAGAIPSVALSDAGTLVYAPSPGREDDELVWVDRAGQTTPVPGGRGWIRGAARLSPDGQRAALVINDGPDRDIWILDLVRGTRRRLTFDGRSRWPVWSPDGAWIAFQQRPEEGEGRIVRIPADGSGEADLIAPLEIAPTTWSPDGRTLVATEFTAQKLWIVPIEGEVSELKAGPGRKGLSSFSPDGRWLAFTSAESGRDEVYVRPFPGPGGVTLVSNGGREPFWSTRGDELFYYSAGQRRLFVVEMETSDTGVRAGTPRLVLEGNYLGLDLSGDGRFLMNRMYRPPPITELRVVVNWTQELEERVR